MFSRVERMLVGAIAALDSEVTAPEVCKPEPDHLEAIRAFCEDVQIAGLDYHAPITAGQIVNLLAGRDAYDDGELLRC